MNPLFSENMLRDIVGGKMNKKALTIGIIALTALAGASSGVQAADLETKTIVSEDSQGEIQESGNLFTVDFSAFSTWKKTEKIKFIYETILTQLYEVNGDDVKVNHVVGFSKIEKILDEFLLEIQFKEEAYFQKFEPLLEIEDDADLLTPEQEKLWGEYEKVEILIEENPYLFIAKLLKPEEIDDAYQAILDAAKV